MSDKNTPTVILSKTDILTKILKASSEPENKNIWPKQAVYFAQNNISLQNQFGEIGHIANINAPEMDLTVVAKHAHIIQCNLNNLSVVFQNGHALSHGTVQIQNSTLNDIHTDHVAKLTLAETRFMTMQNENCGMLKNISMDKKSREFEKETALLKTASGMKFV